MDQPNGVYLPEGSICKTCIYCMSRIIEPLDYEAFGLDGEDKSNLIVQSLCLLSDVNLHDHVVKSCSRFDTGGNLLMGDRFLA